MTELFPVQKNLPILPPEDEVTHAEADFKDSLQNPASSSPTPKIGEKKTAELNQLAAIFNMDVPREPSTPPAQLLRMEQTPEPSQ